MQKKTNRPHHWALCRFLILLMALTIFLPLPLRSEAQQKGIYATPTVNRPEQSVFMLRDAIKSGKVSLKVQGDGVSTSHIRVLLTSKSATDVVVLIPRFEIFHPGGVGVQKMMSVSDSMANVPAGRVIDFEYPDRVRRCQVGSAAAGCSIRILGWTVRDHHRRLEDLATVGGPPYWPPRSSATPTLIRNCPSALL